MNTVVDLISNGSNPIPVMSVDEITPDLLNRQGIIDQLIQLLNSISDNRSSYTFALNGAWGVG